MKKVLFSFLVVGLVLGLSTVSGATVLTFDDLTPTTISTIPNGYGGFNWSTMGYLHGANYGPNSGYDNGTVSGDYVAFNSGAGTGSITRSTTFDFNGAYFAGAWRDGLNLRVAGFLGASFVDAKSFVVDHDGPTWVDFNFSGIDRVTLSSSGGTSVSGLNGAGAHFAMDNFTFNEKRQNAVPEPATMSLLGFGVLGLLGLRKRKA